MKASELRLGNLCYYRIVDKIGGEYDVINTIDYEDLRIIFGNGGEDYRPIPLTEEWMIKFGFELLPWGFVIKGNEDKAVLIRHSYKSNFKLWLEVGNGLRTELKYVHQLQNLYFALTGLELEIDNI